MAMRAIAEEWREQAKRMANSEDPSSSRIGQPKDWASLAPLLETRASMLLQFTIDDSLWKDTDDL